MGRLLESAYGNYGPRSSTDRSQALAETLMESRWVLPRIWTFDRTMLPSICYYIGLARTFGRTVRAAIPAVVPD